MTTYTLSLDLIRHMGFEDYTPILFRLINPDCEHLVAVDQNLKLLSVYERESLHPDILSTWIKLLQHSQYTKVDFEIDETALSDNEILQMTAKVVGSRKMIVDSLQSLEGCVYVNEHNVVVLGDIEVPVANKGEAIAEIRGTNTHINISHSQIANDHGKISRAEIR